MWGVFGVLGDPWVGLGGDGRVFGEGAGGVFEEGSALGSCLGCWGCFGGLGREWGLLEDFGELQGGWELGGSHRGAAGGLGVPPAPQHLGVPQRPGQHCPHPERPPEVLGLPAEHW